MAKAFRSLYILCSIGYNALRPAVPVHVVILTNQPATLNSELNAYILRWTKSIRAHLNYWLSSGDGRHIVG